MLKTRVVHQKLDIGAILHDVERAEAVALREVIPVVHEVVKATVGTQYYSLHQLARMGHPYGIGRRPPMHPGVINFQSGKFYQGMLVSGPSKVGSQLRIYVSSTDEKSDMLLKGTSRMIARPYDKLLQHRLSRVIAPLFGQALARAINIKVVR